MDRKDNIQIGYKLKDKVLTPKEVEDNKHLFNLKCFSSNEKTDAIIALSRKLLPNQKAILYIHEDLTFTHKVL